MDKKHILFNYIKTVTGWEVEAKNKEFSLPLYLSSSYTFWYAAIADINLVFAYAKEGASDIRLYAQTYKTLKNKLGYQVVFVFDYLDIRQINSLIQKHIPFVVLDKYIYFPFALIQIATDMKSKILSPKIEHLSPDADLILIGYLDGKLYNGQIIKDIANTINRELRATSIALTLLGDLGYIRLYKHGRSKSVQFVDETEVYERMLKEALSPLKKSFFTSSKIYRNKAVKSGYTALSVYSSLVDTGIPTVAISKKDKNLLASLNVCEEDEALHRIEVWDRDPQTFSYDDVINPIYLLRQFKDDDDERVQYALEEIEKKIKQKWNNR